MLYIHAKLGAQSYHFIPKSIQHIYTNLNETLNILEAQASSQRSVYHYSSWEKAIFSAWKIGIKKGASQHLGCELEKPVSTQDNWKNVHHNLFVFLNKHLNKHRWASDNLFF